MSNNNDYTVKKGDQIPSSVIEKYSDIIKKAVEDPNKAASHNTKDIEQQDFFHAMGIAENTASIIETNKEILELFPDIEIATDIRISAIMDPNSQEDEELRIRMAKSKAPSETIGKIIPTVKNNLEDIDLKTIIKEALVDKGAFIEAIIPEPLLDKIILANTEDNNSNGKKGKERQGNQNSIDTSKLDKATNKNFSLGILNSKAMISNAGMLSDVDLSNLDIDKDNKLKVIEEVFKIDKAIISDNILEIKTVQSALLSANSAVKNKLSIFKKKREKITDEDIKNLFSKTKKDREDFVALPAVKASYNKGQSLTIKLPVSSCIPIYPSGEPHNHIGYFVLINPKTGVPIRDEEFAERRSYMNTNMRVDNPKSGDFLSTVLNNLKGYGNNTKEITIADIDKTYARLLDLKIKSVLKDTVFDDIVEVDIEANDAYRVMLSRVLESKDTKMIFMPQELVSYIAFDHRTNGTGKSLMEKISFFASLRAIILFTNLMAKMSNSMTNTVVNAEIDELDKNPKGTRSNIVSNYMNSRGQKIPLYTFNPRDLASWANMFGIQFNIKHPTFGNTEVTIEEKSGARSEVDTELEDLIFQYILYAIGVNKEQIDAAKNDDYATSVIARSKTFAKKIAGDQKKLAPQLSEMVKRRISFNILAYEQIKEIVTTDYNQLVKGYLEERLGKDEAKKERDKAKSNAKNKDTLIDLLVELLIDDIEVYLPKPEVTDDLNNKTIFENYSESLSTVLEAIISDDVIVENEGNENLTYTKDNLIKIAKSVAMMRFLRENNYMQSVTDMFTLDNEGKILVNPIDEYGAFMEALNVAALNSKETIEKNNIKTNKKLNDLNEKLNTEGNDEVDDEGGMGDNNPTDTNSTETNPTQDDIEESGGGFKEEDEFGMDNNPEEPIDTPKDEGTGNTSSKENKEEEVEPKEEIE